MRIILASKSPRRKELLGVFVKNFEVLVSEADEKVESNLSAKENVKNIAMSKAEAVFNKVKSESDEDLIIIGADTIVVVDGEILGKPKDKDDAIRMLNLISGREHEVMTGFCVIIRKDGNVTKFSDTEVSYIYVEKLSDDEIERWLNTGNAWDKTGAYAIQQEFGVHIEKIEGDYFSVVGLPINKIYDKIKKLIY